MFALIKHTVTPADNGTIAADAGFWLTINGGDNWEQTIAGYLDVAPFFQGDKRQFYDALLMAVPGRTKEWLYTGFSGDRSAGTEKLLHITNDGKGPGALTDVHSSVRNVKTFCFGDIPPGQTKPSVYFDGEVDGVHGTFATYDWWFTKPQLITRWPNDNFDYYVSGIASPPGQLGTVECVFANTGGAILEHGVRGVGR